jgi:uncharacterized protein YjiS (DUF1127 family)
MTDICDPSPGDSDREKDRDAPAIVNPPSVWRWLRALSTLRRTLSARQEARRRRRLLRLHRMNDYMLKDIGLTRSDYEDPSCESLHPLMLPFRRSDEERD